MNYPKAILKSVYVISALFISTVFFSNAQEVIFYDDFEIYSNNENLLSLNPAVYTSWSETATWNAIKDNGQGNNSSNTYGISNNQANISIIRFLNLEVGSTYTFSVATKISNETTAWKRNHSIKAQSGTHVYQETMVTQPAENTWTTTESTFTVLDGFQNINFSIYRFSEGNNVCIDDFSIRKISDLNSAIFYIDSLNGNDSNNGNSEAQAWKTISKINNSTFNPGDRILFKTNQEHYGNLIIPSSGIANSPIIFDKYGTGIHPIINGRNHEKCIDASGKQYLEFHNLILKNDSDDDTITPEEGAEIRRYGFYAHAGYTGVKNSIVLSNVKIHKIYPNNSTGTENTDSYKGYGILFTSDGSGDWNYYDGITIENCEITDIGYVGISINKWVPSANPPQNLFHKNITVRNNHLHQIGGSGIVYFNVSDFMIENNLITYTGSSNNEKQHGRGSGFWSVRCKNGVLQNNEFSHVRGQADSCGAHIDIENDNVVVQYNLSLDNEGGFAEYMGANTNCIYRYNISINDGWRVKGVNGNTQWGKTIWFSNFTGFEDEPRIGSSFNHVYNNTIYVKEGMTARVVIGESSHHNTVKNNIFYVDGTIIFLEEDLNYTPETPGHDNLFDTNLWYGSGTFPNIANEIIFNNTAQNEIFNQDPLLVNKGGLTADDYKILESSPVINAGLPIDDNGGFDYWKTVLADYTPTDIGANETTFESLSTTSVKQKKQLSFHPNPVLDYINLTTGTPSSNYSIYTINGSLIEQGIVQKQLMVKHLKSGLYILKLANFPAKHFVKK